MYWLEKVHAFEQRSDKGTDTNSQDEMNHRVHPTDENVVSYCKKRDLRLALLCEAWGEQALYCTLPLMFLTGIRICTASVAEVSNNTC